MANRTSIYKFLYSQFGDIWYPGYDYENMLTAESNFSGIEHTEKAKKLKNAIRE